MRERERDGGKVLNYWDYVHVMEYNRREKNAKEVNKGDDLDRESLYTTSYSYNYFQFF